MTIEQQLSWKMNQNLETRRSYVFFQLLDNYFLEKLMMKNTQSSLWVFCRLSTEKQACLKKTLCPSQIHNQVPILDFFMYPIYWTIERHLLYLIYKSFQNEARNSGKHSDVLHVLNSNFGHEPEFWLNKQVNFPLQCLRSCFKNCNCGFQACW